MQQMTSATIISFIGFVMSLVFASETAEGFGDYPKIRTVAISGQSAPGTEEGVIFDNFDRLYPPVVNDLGETSFVASIKDVESFSVDDTNDIGLWSEGSGALALLAREGHEAVGLPPLWGTYPRIFCELFFDIRLNNNGVTTFRNLARSEITSDCSFDAVWTDESGSIAPVVRDGDDVPGTEEGLTFRGFSKVHQNNGNAVSFTAGLRWPDGSFAGSGLWSNASGAIAGIVSPAPPNAVLNDGGMSAFLNNFAAPAEILSGDHTGLTVVARVGEQAHDLPGYNYFYLEEPVINNQDQVAFRAFTRTSSGGIGPSGLWIYDPMFGAPELVIKAGDPAHGSDGGEFTGFNVFSPILNGSGHLAFVGSTTTQLPYAGQDGIWAGSPGVLQLVARRGQLAPGADEGFQFCFFYGPTYNAAGDIAFIASLRRDGEIFCNRGIGIWAWTPTDGVIPIVIEGDTIEVGLDATEEKTVASLATTFASPPGIRAGSGNEDGRASALGDGGNLAFQANFLDGSSGIFVATLRPADPVDLLVALVARVGEMEMEPGTASALTDKASVVLRKLTDASSGNDKAAFRQLLDFLSILDAHEAAAKISEADAAELREQVNEILAILTA